ncbi:hypothetical protein [Paucibacter sp. DJ2R-2]|uniref:hypothetical protein n=1 Tax=Paucibacter sp. DJ2R-2 TaxID=2893558 RepID=UPI0021E4CEFF|nr:hypothetical protein [Paucibacter sp. DJ2R-2]MCV2423703.1 hypothetical protein [Paucibacter sp. DJ4R-1]MCV2441526.1 hypothetical protein [Paucibacter sp. DJ2R-2]
MGSFYTSHTLRGPSQRQVLDWLDGRSAFVSQTDREMTTVLDEACESQDGEDLAGLALQLSAHFHCPVLAVLNHDDDILYFELYEDGEKTDEYNSSPGYFDEEVEDNSPRGGDALRLAAVFGASDAAAIETVLRNPDYVFAMERHDALATALGLPKQCIGIGFNYADAGEFPPGTAPEYFSRSGGSGG